MITIRLDVPDAWVERARYACRALALRWGIPLRFTTGEAGSHACYTTDPSACPPGTVALEFDRALYEPATACGARRDAAGRWIWSRQDLEEGKTPDLVGGVFRLLVSLDESQIPEDRRDRRGIFITESLPAERRRVADQPLVEHHAAALLDALLERHPGLERARVPRWPQGRRFALVPSHDVDAVDLGAPLELATNFAKAVLRRSGHHAQLFASGVSAIGRPSPGPYFAFPRWREWERERGLRSAFFVFFRPPGVPRDINDCKSGLGGRGTDWDTLRRMAAEGWEFGLHPSIHTKDFPGGFEASKAWLESRIGSPVHGVRHHYWALDWRDPSATHRQHQQAGFHYDSSIAWRDRAGFRAGTALPYHPFDRESGRALDLIEIPCALMDGHILHADARGTRTDPESALSMGCGIIERVRETGGVLVTNWHQEVAFDRLHVSGFMGALDCLIEPLRHSSEVWIATPTEVCAHWRDFCSGLFAEEG